MKLKIQDMDVIYLSYDEPRVDEFFVDLRSKCPWAKRVHGVKGFDSAHKACAELSETDRFITVDGDNIVDERFFSSAFELPDAQHDCVFSWAGRNMVNGLIYGNGGLKCWPTEFVKNMKTHENSEQVDDEVDFCWNKKYVQIDNTFSQTYPNGSPFQSFRSGFREGVKMTINRGKAVSLRDIDQGKLWHGNIKRLQIWCSVGSDVENGLWCMYGTRFGVYMTNLTEWDHRYISDYDWFNHFWETEVQQEFSGGTRYCRYTDYKWNEEKLWNETVKLGDGLRRSIGLKVADLDHGASLFFKDVYVAPSRTGYQ